MSLRNKGAYDDSVRLNRRQKRKTKDGIFQLCVSNIYCYRGEKKAEERQARDSGVKPQEVY